MTDISASSSEGYSFSHRDIAHAQRRFDREIESAPELTDDSVVERKHEWAPALFMLWTGDVQTFAEDCAVLMKTCPDLSWLDKGVENSLRYMNNRLICGPYVARQIINGLSFMLRLRAVNRTNEDRVYYENVSSMMFTCCAYVSMCMSEHRKPDRHVQAINLLAHEESPGDAKAVADVTVSQ